MNYFKELPQGYLEICSINLQKDKKTALLVNAAAVLIMAVFGVLGHFIVPVTSLFDMSEGYGIYFGRLLAIIVGLIAYIILHEAVHGVCMKLFGADKVNYGFTGLYAYAGSDGFFTLKPYMVIALAPVVFWGAVLLIINLFVGREWFWAVWLIQISNISGAAGDLYVTYKFLKMPKDILVNDTGTAMTVYSRSAKDTGLK